MFRLLSFAAVTGFASLLVIGDPAPVLAEGAQENPAESSDAMPARERELLELFTQQRQELAAERSIQGRKDALIGLEQKIAAFMRESQIAEGWKGTVLNVGRTPEGDYWITVEIEQGGVTIFTPRNRRDDHDGLMLIKPSSALTPIMKSLKVGDPVTFTAKMFGLEVTNEEDVMARPQFYAQFIALKPN